MVTFCNYIQKKFNEEYKLIWEYYKRDDKKASLIIYYVLQQAIVILVIYLFKTIQYRNNMYSKLLYHIIITYFLIKDYAN